MLESGGSGIRKDVQSLADADIADSSPHVPMNIAVQRRLGGTSNLWGGRCVPLDALDFEPRPVLNDSTWPITGADLTPFLPAACEYLGCGPAVFEKPIPGLENVDASFRVDHLERWSWRPTLGKSYLPELGKSPRVALCLLATVVGFKFDDDSFPREIYLRGPEGAKAAIRVRDVVLAAGGLENTRLLLEIQRKAPGRFCGPDGPLGRYYMGHLQARFPTLSSNLPSWTQGWITLTTRTDILCAAAFGQMRNCNGFTA